MIMRFEAESTCVQQNPESNRSGPGIEVTATWHMRRYSRFLSAALWFSRTFMQVNDGNVLYVYLRDCAYCLRSWHEHGVSFRFDSLNGLKQTLLPLFELEPSCQYCHRFSGRFDQCPCRIGTSARMAVLHARAELKESQTFRHRSITKTEFVCQILGTTKVGDYNAVLPRIKGRAYPNHSIADINIPYQTLY